ncbi:PH domain-containing protein [Glycomyces terrestris]|uniref:PH domain-containing protein n=1 Tax=Glycomyces terrestris TaxID=2493553 RepID=A0A426UUM8_9ACTN|nr:PH domain-containing protein [Glycomyces terrestris]
MWTPASSSAGTRRRTAGCLRVRARASLGTARNRGERAGDEVLYCAFEQFTPPPPVSHSWRSAVGYPDDQLARGEVVKLHTHPHWKEGVAPILWFVVFLAIGAIAITYTTQLDWDGKIWLVLAEVVITLALLVWLSVIPWIRWRSTHYVITDQRIMWREGLVTRESRHIPLARVNTVSYTQNVWERIFGFGDMNIDSASDDGEINLVDVPRVDKTKALLYQLAEDDRARRAGEGDGA